MSEPNAKLVKAMQAEGLTDKPKVDDLARLAGVDKVTAEERDAAWKAYREQAPAESREDIEGIFVKAVPGATGFRRAGFAFDETGYGIALGALSEEQLEAIENEPRLITERCTFTDKAKVKVR